METQNYASSEAAKYRSLATTPVDSFPISDLITEAARSRRIRKITAWQPGQTPPDGTIAKGNILTDTTTPEPLPVLKMAKPIFPPETTPINTDTIVTIPDEIGLEDLQPYIDFAHGGPNPIFEQPASDILLLDEATTEPKRGIVSRLKSAGEIFVNKFPSPRRNPVGAIGD